MLSSVYDSFWDDLLDPLKVTFDGDNKLIIVNTQYSSLTVKSDIYSASKRWLQRRNNSAYARPMRAIGGDPVISGLYAGDIYFLTNDWQIVVNNQVAVTGIIYSDNVNLNTFIINSGGGVQSQASNLAYSYNTTGVTVPTASQVASAVWNDVTSNYGSTTIAGKIAKLDDIQNTTHATLALNS